MVFFCFFKKTFRLEGLLQFLTNEKIMPYIYTLYRMHALIKKESVHEEL